MINSETNKFSIAQKLKQSVTLKIVAILFITLLLMIPIMSIRDLVRERSGLKTQIENDVAKAYGQKQTIIAPVLKIPYTHTVTNSEGKKFTSEGLLTVTPEKLSVDGDLQSEKRKRSIYEVVVYRSQLNMTGEFKLPDLDKWANDNYRFNYEHAYLSMGISDNNGLYEDCIIKVDNEDYELSPGLTQDELMQNSLSTKAIDLMTKSQFTFSLDLKIKGTKSIQFVPVAKNSTVKLESPWLSPSFVGSNIPQTYDITDEGFEAEWTTNQYGRSYPHFWFKANYNFMNIQNAFGVTLIEPVDGYAKNARSSKYSLLVISLTFAVFFFFEIMYKKNIHAIQYVMIGFSLATFYLLLISLTEHIGFNKAYLGSATATILLIVSYTQFIIQSKKAVGILLFLLGALFSYIFIILQLEEFALLAGSIGLFVILSMVMLLSRNIDWYNLNKS